MKKKLLILLILIFIFPVYTMPYYKRCPKCEAGFKKHLNMVSWGWRSFETPIKKINGELYATYKCPHGHTFLAKLE